MRDKWGEYTGDYNELIYLRARHYAPGMGRFLTRDTWEGDYNRPISFNRWMYGYGNPVKYVDPSGRNPECWTQLSAQICALDRFYEILQENSNNGVNALASLFTDSELQNMGGLYAGTTSATRLEWILKLTLGSNKSWLLDLAAKASCALPGDFLAFHFQFATSFPSGVNSGLPVELEDSQFYGNSIWIEQESNQIAHFLSAVSEYYYGGVDIQLIIAHEKSIDPCGATCPIDMYVNLTNEVTPDDILHFFSAWYYDENGKYAERDRELWEILDFPEAIAVGDVDRARQGNSLQDLRLSLRGVRFADWVQDHSSSPANEAGQWLTTNLPLP